MAEEKASWDGVERQVVIEEDEDMRKVLHVRATVQPGGKVEIASPELEAGQTVDVVISPAPRPSARSAWEIISEAPGHRLFKTGKEVDDYIKEERASWDR